MAAPGRSSPTGSSTGPAGRRDRCRHRPAAALADQPVVPRRAQRRAARAAPLDGFVAELAADDGTRRAAVCAARSSRRRRRPVRRVVGLGEHVRTSPRPTPRSSSVTPTGDPTGSSYHAAEHRSVRDDVGLFDMSSMSKFLVQGPDAESLLNRLSGNDVAVPVGPLRLHPVDERARRRDGRRHDHPARRRPVPGRRRRGVPPPGRVDAAAGGTGRRPGVRHRRHLRPGAAQRAGPELAGAARRAHHRRPVQRGVPVPDRAGDRPPPRPGAGGPDELRRRTRLGAVRADRVRARRVRPLRRGRCGPSISPTPAWRRSRARAPKPAGSTTASTWRTPTRRSRPD